jgi:hypothetical protein
VALGEEQLGSSMRVGGAPIRREEKTKFKKIIYVYSNKFALTHKSFFC